MSSASPIYDLTAMRALFALLVERAAGLSDAGQLLRMVKTIHRLLRGIITLERLNIARMRRDAVLASVPLRQAAFAAIGLLAILRWEEAWRRRSHAIKPHDYSQKARKPNAPRQSLEKAALDYALMPLPKCDYARGKHRVRDETDIFESASIPILHHTPLPPAMVYPHEICDRPPVWAVNNPRRSPSRYNAREQDTDVVRKSQQAIDFIDDTKPDACSNLPIRAGPKDE